MADKPDLFKPNDKLETKVQKDGDYPKSKVVDSITRKLGLLNVIRNARNEKQSQMNDIEKAM